MEIKRSKNMPTEFLYDILKIDNEVYDEDLCGDFDSLNSRFQASKESYLLLFDEDKMVGYMAFFPISDDLYTKITTLDMVFDDNIDPIELVPYSNNYHMYIISIAIKESYRDKNGIKLLLAEFAALLDEKQKEGFSPSELTALAVSGDGSKLLNSIGLKKMKTIQEKYSLYSGQFQKKI